MRGERIFFFSVVILGVSCSFCHCFGSWGTSWVSQLKDSFWGGDQSSDVQPGNVEVGQGKNSNNAIELEKDVKKPTDENMSTSQEATTKIPNVSTLTSIQESTREQEDERKSSSDVSGESMNSEDGGAILLNNEKDSKLDSEDVQKDKSEVVNDDSQKNHHDISAPTEQLVSATKTPVVVEPIVDSSAGSLSDKDMGQSQNQNSKDSSAVEGEKKQDVKQEQPQPPSQSESNVTRDLSTKIVEQSKIQIPEKSQTTMTLEQGPTIQAPV